MFTNAESAAESITSLSPQFNCEEKNVSTCQRRLFILPKLPSSFLVITFNHITAAETSEFPQCGVNQSNSQFLSYLILSSQHLTNLFLQI